MSICPRFVLVVSNLLMVSLLSVPLMLCVARAAEPSGRLALLPGPTINDRLADAEAPSRA